MWTCARTYNSHATPPKMPNTLSRLSKKKTPLRNVTEQCCSPGGGGGGGGVLPYMGDMCRCEGYGFQAVYSRIGYINQSVWV